MKNIETALTKNLQTPRKTLLDDRRFLNKNGYHSVAAICAVINLDFNNLKWHCGVEAEISISDCSRAINLDIDVSDEKGLDNSIFKMQQIKEVCENIEKTLEELRPHVKKYQKNGINE